VEEAEHRGLSNLSSTVDALDRYMEPKHVELFAKHGVYTAEELAARNEIHLENYCTVIGIEARTMVDMVKRDLFPAVTAYTGHIASAVTARKSVLPDVPCVHEERLLRRLAELSREMMDNCDILEAALAEPNKGEDAYVSARYYRERVFFVMEKLRAAVDELETITASEFWPYPSYTDLLFSVR